MRYKGWIITSVIVVFFGALFIYGLKNPTENIHHDSSPWNAAMVEGSPDAPNKMIEYSDYFCEYCTMLRNQASSDAFQKGYIDTGKVQLETRIVTILSGRSPNAEQGAEAAFCSADQGRFTKYGDDIMPRIKRDFFDRGVGVKAFQGRMLTQPKPIDKLPLSYFSQSAQTVGMDVPKFEQCMQDGTHRDQIATNTNRAIELGVQGLPYIVVNDYIANGFEDSWANFEMLLKAGGV